MHGGGGESQGGGRRGRAQSLDFDLNIAPIIDCFVVLITFLLLSASFISIGILDSNVTASSTPSTDAAPVQVRVEIGLDKSIRVHVSGKSTENITVNAKEGVEDLESLTREMQRIKGKWSSLDSVTLEAENGVEYKEVILAMEKMRAIIPGIVLGGF